MSQTTAQKVVALKGLAEDLYGEVRALCQRAKRAEAAIARVRALHAPYFVPDSAGAVSVQCCNECWSKESDFHHPCPTLRALDGDA